MAAFNYRALDADGKESAGIVDAESGHAARSTLRSRGLFPLHVDDVAQARQPGSHGNSRFGPPQLRAAELCLLTRQWSTLLISGLTMEQSLSALLDQAEREAVRQVVAGVRAEIVGG